MRKYILLGLLVIGLMQAEAQDVFNISGQDWQFFYAKDKATADSLAATGFGQRDYDGKGFQPSSTVFPSSAPVQD